MALHYIFFAFFVIQGAFGTELTAENSFPIERGLNEEVAKLLDQLKEAVHDAIEKIIAIGKDIYDHLSDEVKAALQDARKDFEDVVAKAKDKIEDLVNSGADLGAQSIECILAEKDNLIEELHKFEKDVAACVNDAKEKADALVTKALTALNSIKARAMELIDKWSKCTNILCKLGVISNVNKEIKNVRETIREFIVESKEFVKSAGDELIHCTKETAAAHAGEVQIILGRVSECLNSIKT